MLYVQSVLLVARFVLTWLRIIPSTREGREMSMWIARRQE